MCGVAKYDEEFATPRTMMKRQANAIALVLCAVLSGCSNNTSNSQQNLQQMASGVEVSPVNVTVLPRQSQQFTATLTGTDQAINWSVTGDGTISGSGVDSKGNGITDFTAGSSIGQATVTATSAANSAVASSATVTVHPFVQSAGFTSRATVSNPASSYSATFNGSVAQGDLIVVAFWWNWPLGGQIVSVRDSVGNAYKQALITPAGNNDNGWMYYATNISNSNGTPITVTVIVSQATADQFSMAILDYTAVSTLDAISTDSGVSNSSTVASSGSAVTHQTNELIIGVVVNNNVNPMQGSAFTMRFTSDYFLVEDKIVSAPGLYDAEFFLPMGGAWEAGMGAFF